VQHKVDSIKRVAILAALPGELKPLVKGWRFEKSGSVSLWTGRIGSLDVIAACAGAGQPCATRAFAEVERRGAIDHLVSWGWVGALHEQFEPGKAYRCSLVIDQQTGERFATVDPGEAILVTSPRVADEAEKQRLAASYQAGLVDMEAASIARLAAMRGIRFSCLKGVSDGFHDHLPDFNRFLGPDGQMRMGKLVLSAILHPHWWPALMRMGENSSRAAKAMAIAARQIFDESSRTL